MDSAVLLYDGGAVSQVLGVILLEADFHGNPNPYNSSVKIHFRLEETSPVRLRLLNLAGEQTAEMHQGRLAAGEHTLSFSTDYLASGLCCLEASAPFCRQTLKFLIANVIGH